ncbi:MAG TPA: PEP-CTERM sorting domain-containing protein [Rhizomicrobium sp.]|jgi:hypothetical protein|nr:PEP-CTERM sorting domain-containing protein [Rhizomicrobium sp.]
MSDTALRLTKHFSGTGIALALFLGMAAQAEARGIVADSATFTSDTGACTFAMTCSNSFLLNNTSIYVYQDGMISIGSALTSPPASGFTSSTIDLSTFGNYIAAGLFNYSSSTHVEDGSFFGNLEIRWTFDGNTFGINLNPESDGSIQAVVMYDDNLAFSPDTVISSNYSGCQSATETFPQSEPSSPCSSPDAVAYDASTEYVTPDSNFDYDNLVLTIPAATTAVPEPADWSIMLFGLGAIGGMTWQLRRRRAARARS